MKTEHIKAGDFDEIVWLRLNRLRSVKLCEDLIRNKLKDSPNPEITDDIIKSKAIGLSSAIDSAIGYWQKDIQSLNAKVLSRYYFMLQMTIAEQVSSVKTIDDLRTVQQHTEYGHGLRTIPKEKTGVFPDDFYILAMHQGHFHSYTQFLGINTEKYTVNSGKKFPEDSSKAVNIIDLFRRIPELRDVIEEYTGLPPYCFNLGFYDLGDALDYSESIDEEDDDILKKFRFSPSLNNTVSYISFYDQSEQITVDYLSSLKIPFDNFQVQKGKVTQRNIIVGRLTHPPGALWHEYIQSYTSSYSPTVYVVPLWDETNDSIVINFTLLYSLSIIVRYMPDLWYKINSGNLSHYRSLIEYYVSLADHVLPHKMLERITGSKIKIDMPGSIFGQA